MSLLSSRPLSIRYRVEVDIEMLFIPAFYESSVWPSSRLLNEAEWSRSLSKVFSFGGD